VLVASNARAGAELGWQPTRSGIEQVVEAAWMWRREHPDGYRA
jgi:UDP-glucose 4-epimerase